MPALLAQTKRRMIKISSTSEEIVRKDNPDLSNTSHATVEATITTIETPQHFHSMISAAKKSKISNSILFIKID